MENPEIDPEYENDEDFLRGIPENKAKMRGRSKNAKQLTWVPLLKAHQAAGCLSSTATAVVSLTAQRFLGLLLPRSRFALALGALSLTLLSFFCFFRVFLPGPIHAFARIRSSVQAGPVTPTS